MGKLYSNKLKVFVQKKDNEPKIIMLLGLLDALAKVTLKGARSSLLGLFNVHAFASSELNTSDVLEILGLGPMYGNTITCTSEWRLVVVVTLFCAVK